MVLSIEPFSPTRQFSGALSPPPPPPAPHTQLKTRLPLHLNSTPAGQQLPSVTPPPKGVRGRRRVRLIDHRPLLVEHTVGSASTRSSNTRGQGPRAQKTARPTHPSTSGGFPPQESDHVHTHQMSQPASSFSLDALPLPLPSPPGGSGGCAPEVGRWGWHNALAVSLRRRLLASRP